MTDILVFPPGTAIQFTQGCYSDFRSVGFVITLTTCDLPALARIYRETWVKEDEEDWRDRAPIDGFVPWLITQGHVMPGAVSEVHLGEYGYDWAAELSDQPGAV